MSYTNAITSWSFSRLNEYLSCPFKAKLKFITKLKEPESPAFAHGNAIHSNIEQYILGAVDKIGFKLSAQALNIIDEARSSFRAGIAETEASWNFRKNWTETVWNDWNGCFLRVKIDFFAKKNGVVEIRDWKTGKYRDFTIEEYKKQLKLYALATFKKYPDVDTVEASLVFVEFDGHVESLGVARSEMHTIEALFMKDVETMMNDKVFEPKPSFKCKWCHWRKENGGLCKF